MAFNWQTFRTRTLTAAVFVVVMLTGLLWNHWSFLILFSIIHFGCWWEYLKLTEKIHQTVFHTYTKLGLMVMGYGLMVWFCTTGYNIQGYGLKTNFSLPLTAAGFALLLLGIFQKNVIKLKSFYTAVLGIVYISMSWGMLINLYRPYEIVLDSPYPDLSLPFYPIIIIVSLWINDTMAYISGSLIGKTPLSKISPKKTWEGTISGIILSVVLVGSLASLGFSSSENHKFVLPWYIISAIASVTGTVGDLLESKLKRMAGVKDSGNLMPGHGGFLDRFDSLLLAIPFVWLYLKFLCPEYLGYF